LRWIEAPRGAGVRDRRVGHAQHVIRHAIGFLFEPIARLVDCQLGLNQRRLRAAVRAPAAAVARRCGPLGNVIASQPGLGQTRHGPVAHGPLNREAIDAACVTE
jgi:hypothetical protein